MSRAGPPTRRRVDGLATLALAAVTVSVAVGLGRLLADASFLAPVVGAAAVTHLCAWVGRRSGWPTLPAVALCLGVATFTIVLIRYGGPSTAGLPNRDVLDALGVDLREAWLVFQDEGAPAPVADGFVVAAMAAVVAVAVTSDTLAFRLGAPLEAIAPAGGLFLFTSVLSGPDHRITATLAFVATALAFVLAHRVARQARGDGWLAAAPGRGLVALLRAGATLVVIGLVGGVLLGPVLPGADADPIVDLDADGGEDRVTISPLVDIQSRLVDQSEVEVFTVRSGARAYWRMTALDRFDGRVWSASGDYVGADGVLPRPADGPAPDRAVIRQAFHVTALADIWLPAAYEATTIDAGPVGVEWNAASSSLVVDRDRDSSDEMRYTVTSSAPVVDPITAAATGPAGAALDPLRQLPPDFSPTAVRTAATATADATTPYDQAVALQDFFRSGFEYSLDVPAGHGGADIDRFLEARVGYCEQFSGAYAAMARSLGLPARVAVGFTPGAEDPGETGLFHVRGEHAHAWPEVYLQGLGWVAFEPTPGRGAPGAEAYTGVPEQQQGEPASGDTPTTTTTVAPAVPPGADELAPGAPATTIPTAAEPAGRVEDRNWRTTAIVVPVLLGLAWLLGVPALSALQRRRHRRRASGRPEFEVAVAWSQAEDSLDRIGLYRRATETPMAFATRVQATLDPMPSDAMAQLARAVTALWFGGVHQVDDGVAASCHRAGETVEGTSRRRAGRRQWWLSSLDPRRLVRGQPASITE